MSVVVPVHVWGLLVLSSLSSSLVVLPLPWPWEPSSVINSTHVLCLQTCAFTCTVFWFLFCFIVPLCSPWVTHQVSMWRTSLWNRQIKQAGKGGRERWQLGLYTILTLQSSHFFTSVQVCEECPYLGICECMHGSVCSGNLFVKYFSLMWHE